MQVRVSSREDDDDLAEAAADEFRRLPRAMLAVADAGAQKLRETDSYQNRTGNLRKGTQALGRVAGGAVVVELEMDEAYASFVAAKGYSNFDAVARETERAMDREVDRVAKRLTK